MLHEWGLKTPRRCSTCRRSINIFSLGKIDLRGLIRHSYWTKLVTQKSHRASLAAAFSLGEDKIFHTEHVSATLIGCIFDGSIAMERSAVKVRQLKQHNKAAQ